MRLLFSVYLLHLVAVEAQETQGGSIDPVVSLTNGQIRGGIVSVKGTETKVKQFLGIPFARPPVGPLRLAAPQDPEPWDGERDGTRQPPMCIQDSEMVVNASKVMSVQYTPPELSEDCLYLNVYTQAGVKRGDKLPVMVWLHGGGLAIGAASQYDGAPLAAYENIVVVIVQFRLGILGFLGTGDEHLRGNWGFLDQLAALKWVQENIEAFGGNPQAVTIAGESAGGISASILTLSPQAQGLFHRAIFQSGVAMVGAYTSRPSLGLVKIVGNLTGCNDITSQILVQCLRGKSKQELIDATKKMKIYLGAVVDGVFLTDTAEEVLKRKEVMQVPVMMGITNHEFGWILPTNFVHSGWENGMTRESVLAMLNMFQPAGASSTNSLIADEYLKTAKTPEDIRDRFTELMGDLLMTLPVVKVADYHRDAGIPVYMYEFGYRADLYKHTRPTFVKADHGDDAIFVFGGCFWGGDVKIIGNFSKEDDSHCLTMMKYWGNFVRSGSPNGPGMVPWPPYDRQKQEYMAFDLKLSVRQKLREDRVHFATVTLPKKVEMLAAKSGR
ncbi:carboxylesterase 5A-like [Nerophis ophidion]|uniref:carboxylesterase 5A-like n=1 Tax=Nerophis ophidion TaxID=159077 RepID=UPI002ADFC749|nr:carboxylesterase 5A-like [Nerophis ophidion]